MQQLNKLNRSNNSMIVDRLLQTAEQFLFYVDPNWLIGTICLLHSNKEMIITKTM